MTDIAYIVVGFVFGAFGYWFYTALLSKIRKLKTELLFKTEQLNSLERQIRLKKEEITDMKEYFDWKLGIKR